MKYLVPTLMLMLYMTSVLQKSVEAKPYSGKAIIYVGTFKGEVSKGIYAWRFDSASGKLESLGLVAEASRPLFLAIHPNGHFLYAVSRPSAIDRQNIGVVLAYAIDSQTGSLRLLNSLSSRGIDPAYLSVDQNGTHLLVANFGSNGGEGNVAVFPLKDDGDLAEASDFVQYTGKGVHPQRQQGPHSHAINASPDGRFVIVADLGLDKLFIYAFDSRSGKLKPHKPAQAELDAGAGPRHLAFHPSGRFLYVVSEIDSTITTFSYNARTGTLEKLQSIKTIPADFTGNNSAAEVQVHPNGKFLYSSNRGHDSIAVFSIGHRAGTLSPIELMPIRGKTPGTFGIDPSGSWLISANQGSDSLELFALNPITGRLDSTGRTFAVGTPSCVKFLSLK